MLDLRRGYQGQSELVRHRADQHHLGHRHKGRNRTMRQEWVVFPIDMTSV